MLNTIQYLQPFEKEFFIKIATKDLLLNQKK